MIYNDSLKCISKSPERHGNEMKYMCELCVVCF